MRDTDFSKLLMHLNMLHRYSVHKKSSEIGVYYGQPQILKYLKEHGESSQTQIARALNVSAASMAVSVKRMQKAGLLEKKADDSDMRYNRIKLTDVGLEKERQCFEIFTEVTDKLTYGFSEEEKKTLRSYFERMIDNLSEDGKSADDIMSELKKAHKR